MRPIASVVILRALGLSGFGNKTFLEFCSGNTGSVSLQSGFIVLPIIFLITFGISCALRKMNKAESR